MSDSGRFTLRDLITSAFIVCLLGAVAVRLRVAANDGNSQTKCASNLRQIGLSIQVYANDSKFGSFPRTLFARGASPIPTEYTAVNCLDPFLATGPGPNDVTAALFLIVRSGDIGPEVFTCPQGFATPIPIPPGMPPTTFSNFPGRANLDYAYANPYAGNAALRAGFKMKFTLASDFALAADMAPDVLSVCKVKASSPMKEMSWANSRNHLGAGQNVLYADGHVDWSPTIFCGSTRPIPGSPRDNIYAFGVDATGNTPSAGTHGSPVDQYDSVILPTADLGPQPGALPPPAPVPMEPRVIALLISGGIVALSVLAGIVAIRRARRGGVRTPRADV